MRSNGLTASTYTPVADLEPQVADALLSDLRDVGVAAYTNPIESSTAGGLDRPEFRVGVRERLYVDSAESERVRELIAGRDPELIDDNEDLRWAQLVAGFDRPLDLAAAPWPANEDVTDGPPVVDERDLASRDADRDGPPASPARPWGTRPDTDMSDDDEFLHSTARAQTPRDEDERADRFIPEPPPPLPTLPPYKVVAWVGLVGGPLLLILSAFFGYRLPAWGSGLAVVGFIGGFVTLIATMGDRPDDPWDHPDDGAVV